MTKRYGVVHVAAILALALGVPGCRGCDDKGPKSVLDLPAADAQAVVSVPDLAVAVTNFGAFANRATQKGGGAAFKRLHTAVVGHLGFDPLNVDDYVRAGIQPERGLVTFTEGGSREPLLALGISSRSKFDQGLRELLAQSDGVDTFNHAEHHGFTVTTAGRPFGSEVAPTLHWAHAGSYVLLARAPGLDALDGALARLATPAKEGLNASQPLFAATRQSVGKGDAYVYAALPGSTGTQKSTVVLSATFDANGLRGDCFANLAVPGLQGALGTDPTLPLASRVDTDAVAVLLSRAARPEGLRALRAYPAAGAPLGALLKRVTDTIHLDVEHDVLGNLAGPLTVALHINTGATAGLRLGEIQRSDALRDLLHVSVVADLTNPTGMQSALKHLQADMQRSGVNIRNRTEKLHGKTYTVYEPAVPTPRVGWTVFDRYYVYTAGAARLNLTLARLTGGPSELAGDLQKSVGGVLAQQAGSVLIVRGTALADALTGLTGGADATTRLGMGAVIASGNQMLRTLGDMAVAVSAEANGLRLQVREQLQ